MTDRMELAWLKLGEWFTNIYNTYGGVGGWIAYPPGPKSVIYFPKIKIDGLDNGFQAISIKSLDPIKFHWWDDSSPTSEEDGEQFPNIKTKLLQGNINEFSIHSISIQEHQGHPLHLDFFVEKLDDENVDIRMLWMPYFSLINCANIRERFNAIFQYFFSLQDQFNGDRLFIFINVEKQLKQHIENGIEI
jgi:hypothetical protein